MAKEITMVELARELNVSTVTVSKAMAGQKGVSDELRDRILELAKQRGYVKRKKEGSRENCNVGVIVAEHFLTESQSFYWNLYQKLSLRAAERNCFTFLEVIGTEDEKACELPKILQESKAEGLIIMGAFSKKYEARILAEAGVPLLFLDTSPNAEKCDAVVSNNLSGGCRMTDYLLELGHRKIGFVGTRLATASIDDRYLGYLKALMEHGIEWNPEWAIDDRLRRGNIDAGIMKLPLQNMPTAFFCNCDITAAVLMEKLRKQGFRIPEDISVVGFDNYLRGPYIGEQITTFEIDTTEMAKRALHSILHTIKDTDYSTGVFVLDGRFIERTSAIRIGEPIPFV